MPDYIVSVSHLVTADRATDAADQVARMLLTGQQWVYEVTPVDDAWQPLSAPTLIGDPPMTNLPTPLRTVVQHSAFGCNGDPTFERGLESRPVRTTAEKKAVERAGGILFDDYMEAEDFAEKAMYPDGTGGIIPLAQGTFSTAKIDGLAVYIPVRVVVG